MNILFTTKACNQCKIVKIALDNKGIDYTAVDAEENPLMAGEYEIMSVPVLILGNEKIVGASNILKATK